MKRRTTFADDQNRSGAVLVETALIAPVFALFLVGIMEFGHAYLVIATLNAAAKRGARYGAVDDITTSQVRTRINSILSASINSANATILIKDGSVFDSEDPDLDNISYSDLNNIELTQADAQQLFIVRIEVPYESVALIPPFWVKDITLWGQSVMRHE